MQEAQSEWNDPHRTHADVALIKRALRAGWNVTPEAKAKILDALVSVIDQVSHDAVKLSAVGGVLVRMDAADIAADRLEHDKARGDVPTEMNIRIIEDEDP